MLIELADRWHESSPRAQREASGQIARALKQHARDTEPKLDDLLDDDTLEELERLLRKVLARLETQAQAKSLSRTLGELAAERVRDAMAATDAASAADLAEDAAVHALRVKIKRLRYTIEVLGPSFEASWWSTILKDLSHVQAQMGEFNDQAALSNAARVLGHDRLIGAHLDADDKARGTRAKRKAGARSDRTGSEKPAKAGTSSPAVTADWTPMLELYERRTAQLRDRAVEAWQVFRKSPNWELLDEWCRTPGAGWAARGRAGVPVSELEAKPSQASASTRATGRNGVLSKSSTSRSRRAEHTDLSANAAHTPGVSRTPTAREALDKFRVAAIDVGSNSLRLIVAEASADGSYRVLDDEKETTRLGRGLHESGRMDPAAIEHSAAAVQRMVSIARGYGADDVRVVATAAAREARNAKDLVDAVRRTAGLEMEIISAEQEAQYAYRSAARAFDLSTGPAIVIDIGGGSTEVILSVAGDQDRSVQSRTAGDSGQGSANGNGAGSRASSAVASGRALKPVAPGRHAGFVERIYTIPIGAVRLTEQFGGDALSCGKNFSKMTEFLGALVKKHVGKPHVWPQLAIGTGGTITTLGAMVSLRDAGPAVDGLFAGAVQGMQVNRADLKHTIERLRKLPLKQRSRVAGLSAERADIIVPGLTILDAVLKRFKANALRVHEGGIRDGLLLTMVAERCGLVGAGEPQRWTSESILRGVRRFARACSYEMAHSEHVAKLAVSIFDQLAARGVSPKSAYRGLLTPESRLLLECASVLHDIGYLINYAQHHKHSYHLIVHAELGGLTTRQVQIIANVARYHRASEPKLKHRGFAALEERDRELVRALAGVLRVADGLDRTHTQQVSGVRVVKSRSGLEMGVLCAQEPTVDVWGAHRKSELLASVFARKLNFEWRAGGDVEESGVRDAAEKTAMSQG